MDAAQEWRELFRDEDPARVRSVATAVMAMGYEAEFRSADGRPIEPGEPVPRSSSYVLMVHAEDWPELNDALDEIVYEQDYFDALTDRQAPLIDPVGFGTILFLIASLIFIFAVAMEARGNDTVGVEMRAARCVA